MNLIRLFAALAGTAFALAATCRAVVINEIHFDPDIQTEWVEFIELHNPGTSSVNLSGWQLTGAVEFTCPPGTSLASGGYIVVAQNPAHVQAKFNVTALGPWQGRLDNSGETIDLLDASGKRVDRVDYKLGFPWPTVGDTPGYSIELLHPSLDNEIGGHWRVSARGATTGQNELLFAPGSDWRYFKGTSEASSPASAWRGRSFSDSSWAAGPAPIGYGDTHVRTPLNDMSGNYSSVFFRRTFQLTDPAGVTALLLEAQIDDGMKVWINGVSVETFNAPSGEVSRTGTANSALENLGFVQFNLSSPAPSTYLVAGENVIAVHAFNSSLGGSSDFWFDARLTAERGPALRGPTPGARNSVYTTTVPPALRQVSHEPQSPTSGEPVVIRAKVTDTDGIAAVTLSYQIVEPGNYISLADAAYTTDWTEMEMNDSGTDGDASAGDAVFTARLPGSFQQHRVLVRYRITASDTGGASVTVPYADDPQPNFAYFVYDGVPGWRGAVRPGTTAAVDFSPSEMGRLPAYHLLSKRTDIERATWIEKYGGDSYKWAGTLVYDGEVYDHVHYRARGGVWRYSMGKNMWKLLFNRGHEFQARDNWGKKFPTKWKRLNLGASIQQGNFEHRGEQGMFESVGFRLFNLGGVEAPHTAFVTLRIIDEANEADPTNQYRGDFWGVYLAIEQVDGRFMDAHGLPDGNLYKMENGTGPSGAAGEIKNQSPVLPDDYSDLITFRSTYLGNASDAWYRQNLDLDRYYSYQSVVQAFHHYDICCGKNYYYYHNPDTGKWQVHPWDLDLTWADNMYVGGLHGGTEPFQSRILQNPNRQSFQREFRNRIREVQDLLYNPDQAWTLIDEYARALRGPRTTATILDADRAMWDYNPVMIDSSLVNLGKAGHGRFYQRGTPTQDFAGMVQLMKNYVTYRSSVVLDPMAAETQIPQRPVIGYAGPSGFPINRLTVRSSSYQGPQPFNGMQWRVGEITPNSQYDPLQSRKYEIDAVWQSPVLASFQQEMTLPSEALKVGRTYRARVRMLDAQGTWSRWSAPVEFLAAEPENSAALVAHLRVSELMFNAPAGSDFDYIELYNTSSTLSLDLGGVAFTSGIEFTFPSGTTLAPQSYLLVTGAGAASFRAEYGLADSVPLVASYTGNFSNGGEQVILKTAAAGTDILNFSYGDGPGWPVAADGAGHSLVPLPASYPGQSNGSLDYPGHWRASAYLKGSPGRADPDLPATVLVNEIGAHTDYFNPQLPEYDSNDWIELFNGSTAPVTLQDWYLSDSSSNLKKWLIPTITLPAGGRVTFDEVTGFHAPVSTGFGLDKAGESVFLSAFPGGGQDRVIDAVSFRGQENFVSWGRYPDGDPYPAPMPYSRGDENAPVFAPVVISELMYHPTNTTAVSFEYIEIQNRSGQTVSLFDTNGTWRISSGVSWTFGQTTLAAGDFLLILPFDPADTALMNSFRQFYNLGNRVIRAVGPYQGNLSNSGERVTIEKPQHPDNPGDPVSWVVADELIFFDEAPWPKRADGQGDALERVRFNRSGNDPASWKASGATPGFEPASGVQDRDGDGMPDDWELAHGFDPDLSSDAETDADGDGQSNLAEFLSGTDPLNALSVFHILSVSAEAGIISIRFPAVEGKSYRVEHWSGDTEDSWNLLRSYASVPSTRIIETTDVLEAEERLYRIVCPAP